ncbi:acyltransferase family protein [Mucilaginibacter lappiensis]|uniref:acyltransferase family protein n=1 Tax=Mucilaginibacter lappiensis TaxID=354630 RepID=UPI003D195D70
METTQRQTYLDWLRILSILGVLLFHSAMPYASDMGWHIKNHETSNLMMESNLFMHLFRMPLLFFISGTVSYYMMQRRSTLSFIGLRFRRLFIPLLVGVFIIVPPQIYMERLTTGFKGSYWDFYKTVFGFIPYPKGSLGWNHLWFIGYLLIYDLLFAPLFAWLVSTKSNRFKQKLSLLANDKWVYVLMVPGVVWFGLLAAKLPETNNLVDDGCYFVYWLLFLLAGFICILQPKLMDSLERNRHFALTIGFLSLVVWEYMRWNKIEPGYSGWHFENAIFYYLFTSLQAIIGWAWVLALIGYGKRYLNRPHHSLNYLNQAVYPFYILHQTVIVLVSFYIVQVSNESILSKYIYTVGITFFITVLTYHLLIKPYAPMRFLFGMKPLDKPKKAEPPQAEIKPAIALSLLDLEHKT